MTAADASVRAALREAAKTMRPDNWTPFADKALLRTWPSREKERFTVMRAEDEARAAAAVAAFLRALPDQYSRGGAAFWDAIPAEEETRLWLAEQVERAARGGEG